MRIKVHAFISCTDSHHSVSAETLSSAYSFTNVRTVKSKIKGEVSMQTMKLGTVDIQYRDVPEKITIGLSASIPSKVLNESKYDFRL